MPPLTLFTVIVAGQLFPAVRTSKFGAKRVLNTYANLLRLHVEFDLGFDPRCCWAKEMLVRFFFLHFWGSLSPGIIPLPTQIPDGPFFSSAT
jgi:hypothetical protein